MKQLGKSMCIWEDNIKRVVREIGCDCVDRIDLTQGL
jgi:hypothetical protein